jgi:hypothetical protein
MHKTHESKIDYKYYASSSNMVQTNKYNKMLNTKMQKYPTTVPLAIVARLLLVYRELIFL